MGDFIGSFDDEKEAIEAIKKKNNLEDGGCFEYNYASIYDTNNKTQVYKK